MNASSTIRIVRRVFAVAAVASLLFACSSGDDGSNSGGDSSVSIELARMPLPADGSSYAVVYGILVNGSPTVPMSVVSASSPNADTVDLIAPDGSIVLPSQGLPIPAEGGLVMEPVSYKLHLNGVESVELGDSVPVTIRFDNDETLTFDAIVQELDK